MIVKIVSTIFIAVIGPILVWFLVQEYSDKPMLKFNLSEPISTTISGNKSEYIHELFIKNVGKDEAKKVTMKFTGEEAKFEVRKNSTSDVFNIDKLDGNTEIQYESLPPSGEVRIIIKSPYSIYKNMIKISHSKGLAVEVFSENGWLSIVGNIIYIVIVIIILFVFYSTYSFSQTLIFYGNEEFFLGKKKPILITDKKWNNSRNEAIKTLLNKNVTSREDIKASFCYRFLNNKSGAIISDIEIDAFNNKCCDKVKTYFSESALRSYSLKGLSLLFTIERPAVMPDDQWEEIQKYLSTNYISQYIGSLYLSDRKKITSADTQCPEFIQKAIWSKIVNDVTSIVTGNIISEIINSTYVDPALICDETKINGLPSNNILIIKRAAYAFRIFRQKFQYTKDDAKKLLDEVNSNNLLNDESEREPLAKFCQYVVDMYEKESEIKKRELSVMKKETDVRNLQVEFEASRNKVIKQLAIIDSIISRDQGFLEKIEDYDMPFSPGNEANLRIVASQLRENS